MTPPTVPAPAVRLGLAALLLPGMLYAQQPTGRLTFAVPPSTWRLTVTAEGMPDASVVSTPERPAIHPSGIAAGRLNLRLGTPVWKRGLYRTVVANEFAVERIGFQYGEPSGISRPLPGTVLDRGPVALNTLQHDLLVSQAIGTKWRVSGVLQHGFFSMGAPTLDSYQAAGGVFVTRVYRPTLQVGVGAITLNVSPWWIPTLRIVHVGKKWRSDVLLPRAETWYDVGRGVELGATLRFIGNAWQSGDVNAATGLGPAPGTARTTWTQGTIGPAANLRLGSKGLLTIEGGAAQRRMVLEGGGGTSRTTTYLRSRLDQGFTPFLRTAFRATF